jgi:hypothetical protein
LLKRKDSDAVVVVDAKYKRLKGDPSKADQYQIWFYSLKLENVSRVALIYPKIGDEQTDMTTTTLGMWECNNPFGDRAGNNEGRQVELYPVVLSFPPRHGAIAEIGSASQTVKNNWVTALATTADALVALLRPV